MPIERVPAELRGEDGKVYHLHVDVTPGKAISADESSTIFFRIVENAHLSPGSGSGVPDGKYERTFVFDGRPQKDRGRMRGGRWQGGW